MNPQYPYYFDYNPNEKPTTGSHDFCGDSEALTFYGNITQQQYSMQKSLSTSTHDSFLDGSASGQHGQQMKRGNSAYSNTSYDNQYTQPSSSYAFSPNAAYVPSISTTVPSYCESALYDYQQQPTFSTMTTTSSYVPGTPRMPLYPQTLDSLVSPTSPEVQSSIPQTEKPEFICLHGCGVKPFARNADLKRHMDHMHGSRKNLEKWYCDRKNCNRSEKGYQAMLERTGRVADSQDNSNGSNNNNGRDSGQGPFSRKDHLKAHLRDIHKEPLWKRNPKDDPNWLEGKTINDDWWRCPKCLSRVYVKKSGWTCPSPCDLKLERDVVAVMQAKMDEARRIKKHSESSSRRSHY